MKPITPTRRMTTRSKGGNVKTPSTRNDDPSWKNADSNRDLKIELRKRINAYFSFPQNRETMDDVYHSFVTNGAAMSAQKLIKVATEELQLKTVRTMNVKYGTLSSKVTFLVPFTNDMEKPIPVVVETELPSQQTVENSPTDVEQTIDSQEISVPNTPTQDSVDLLEPSTDATQPSNTSTEWKRELDQFKEEIKTTVLSQVDDLQSCTVTLINQATKTEFEKHFQTYEQKMEAHCGKMFSDITNYSKGIEAKMKEDAKELHKTQPSEINRMIRNNIQETVVSNMEYMVNSTMERCYNTMMEEATSKHQDKIQTDIDAAKSQISKETNTALSKINEDLNAAKVQMRNKSLQSINDVVKSTDNQVKINLQEFQDEIKDIKKNAVKEIATDIKERNMRFIQLLTHKSEDCVENIKAAQQKCVSETGSLTDAIKQSNAKEFDTYLAEGLQDINEETAQAIQTIVDTAQDLMKENEKQIAKLYQDLAYLRNNLPHAASTSNPQNQKHTQPIHPNIPHATPNPTVQSSPSTQQPQTGHHPSYTAANSITTNHYRISDFHKHVRATIDNQNQILNFYQQIYTQGPSYGIHLRKLEDLRSNQDLCPQQFTADQRNDMSRTIYQKLQDGNCVSKSYTQAQNIITQNVSTSDGYTVLYQLLRFVHPRLMESQNAHTIPKMSQIGDLYMYCDRLTNFILLEKINGRVYSTKEQITLYLQHLDDERYSEAKSRCYTELRQQTVSANSSGINPDLYLPSLPTTITQYQNELKPITDTGRSYINQITSPSDIDIETPYEEDTTPVLRAISSVARQRNQGRGAYNRRGNNNFIQRNWRPSRNFKPVQCRGCGAWGHDDLTCQFVAKVQIASQYIQNNAKSAKALAQEYLRTNSRKMKQSTIRTLMAYDQNVAVPPGEDLLQHYDIDIDMEEIDFQ